jgi:ABC-type branched-subunit amino acid transport system substrate-binding protein/LysM repeat protein
MLCSKFKVQSLKFKVCFGIILQSFHFQIFKFSNFSILYRPIFSVIFPIFCFSIITDSIAQNDKISSGTLKTAVSEDPIYYMHKVENKQTLFSIAKLYNVEVTEIVLANPEAEKQIIPGQLLRIPLNKIKPKKPSPIHPDSIDQEKFIAHQVIKSQTLYSISKLYEVNIDEVLEVNPQIKEGLKYGQVILIPRKNSKKKKEEDKISEIPIPANTNIEEKKPVKNSYKIAIMLPFYLNKNKELEEDELSYETETVYESSEIAIKFYEGLLMAIDSLKKSGFNAQLFVYETGNDSASVQKIIHKAEFKEFDLIIGPFFPSNIVMVADSAKKYNIPVVSPLSNSDLLLTRDNIIKATPSKNSELQLLASYIDTAFANQNVIILHNDKAEEKKMIAEYKQKCLDSLKVKAIHYYSSKSGIDYFLNDEKKNVIILFSTQEDFVTNVITKLNARRNDYDIHLISLSSFEKLKNLEVQYLQNLNYGYTTPYFVDYNNDKVLEFVRNFLTLYKTEPDKYAFIGFDLAYYIFGQLKSNGKKMMNQIEVSSVESMHTLYLFKRSDKNSALENNYYSIVKFRDYQMIKLN